MKHTRLDPQALDFGAETWTEAQDGDTWDGYDIEQHSQKDKFLLLVTSQFQEGAHLRMEGRPVVQHDTSSDHHGRDDYIKSFNSQTNDAHAM